MAKTTVRLNADERAICRVRYIEVSKNMDIGFTSRSTDGICKAIAAYWKDGSLETGSEYSALLFPFGNPRAVHRHINEAHVDKADRAIAETWVKKQPASKQARIRGLLGLEDGGEKESEEELTSDPESDVNIAPTRNPKRKATKEILTKSKPAAKHRRQEQTPEANDVDVKSEIDVEEKTKLPVKARNRRMGKQGNAVVKNE
ncbi:hypothetical protein C8R47DRAFT_564182 [Mycena vitilis]|nr:hypothetical protein C8R47DRAFT_564182 [Mycena vitilis]